MAVRVPMSDVSELAAPRPRWVEHHHRSLQILVDSACWGVAVLIACLIRFDLGWAKLNAGHILTFLPLVVFAQVVAGMATGVYRGPHRFNRVEDVGILAKAVAIASVWLFFVERWVLSSRPVPIAVTVGGGFIALVLMAGARYPWTHRGTTALLLTQTGRVEGIHVGRRKRVFDVMVAVPLTILLSPVIAVSAVISAWSLRAWLFFVQERIGRSGATFLFIKIRTLPPHAPRYGLKTDPAIVATTPLLAAIRRTHLDELPQLLLVLTGRMTLVGPRPRMPDAHESVPDDYHEHRTKVPQGCTGLWQISIDRDRMPHESPEYDFFYITHWSVRLDAWVLYRTCRKMLGVGGPVELCHIPTWTLGRQPIAADLLVGRGPGEVPERVDLGRAEADV